MVSTDETDLTMEQEAAPAKHTKFGPTAPSSANDKGNVQKNDSEVRPIDPLANGSSGNVDAAEDENEARELSAALDQNITRRGRFQRNPNTAEGDTIWKPMIKNDAARVTTSRRANEAPVPCMRCLSSTLGRLVEYAPYRLTPLCLGMSWGCIHGYVWGLSSGSGHCRSLVEGR